jgi:phospholipase C
MSTNIYSTWQPIPKLTGRVIVDKVEDTDEGLAIYIHQSKTEKKFKILFDSYVAYRNMDESYRVRTVSEHGGFENSLNIVTSSSWLEWMHAESQGYYQGEDIIHYSVITDADFIDILSEFDPEIQILK